MTGKVIYVSVGRLTDKIARDWCIDFLMAQGVDVEYWDIVPLVREEHSEQGETNPPYLHKLRSFGELEERLRLAPNRHARYVMLISYAGQTTRIFRLFSRYDCRMLLIAWGAMPRDSSYKWRKIMAVLASPWWAAREIFYRTRAVACRKLRLVKPYAIVFAAGEQLLAGDLYSDRVVPINLCDYDLYVKARGGRDRLVSGRYAVFLDINLPFQSDLQLVGYPQIEPASYYRSLNRFFDLVERQYGLQVVIAAHPKANYDAATFAGRQLQRLATAELVRDAEFVPQYGCRVVTLLLCSIQLEFNTYLVYF